MSFWVTYFLKGTKLKAQCVVHRDSGFFRFHFLGRPSSKQSLSTNHILPSWHSSSSETCDDDHNDGQSSFFFVYFFLFQWDACNNGKKVVQKIIRVVQFSDDSLSMPAECKNWKKRHLVIRVIRVVMRFCNRFHFSQPTFIIDDKAPHPQKWSRQQL